MCQCQPQLIAPICTTLQDIVRNAAERLDALEQRVELLDSNDVNQDDTYVNYFDLLNGCDCDDAQLIRLIPVPSSTSVNIGCAAGRGGFGF